MREIEQWLLGRLTEITGLDPSAIRTDAPLESLGLSSQEAVGLSGELEERCGRRLSPTLLWEYPTIQSLAAHLANDAQNSAPRPDDSENFAITPRATQPPIAIVGMACRFPGAHTLEEFWQLLAEGRCAISEVPEERWKPGDYFDPRPGTPGKTNSKWGGFLDQIDLFDPAFFGISRREATRMDPAQRLLLEAAWRAMEDACIPPARLAEGNTGVFVGISTNDYLRRQCSDPLRIDAYTALGNALGVAANRLSYVFNFRGPSLAVDTACASSLTALHLAMKSLAAGECDAALVAGVNVLLSPEMYVAFSQARLLAADGRCKTFDADADGYTRGEGCGVLLLKRLDDAQTAHDRIHAVLRGSALAHGGRGNGLMSPSRRAIQQAIQDAMRAAGSSPERIGCIEVQGTATPLGDAIEIEALRAIFGVAPEATCAIGSVKTNLGHLEAAAGAASVMKMVLALRHGTIPAHLHLRELHTNIDLRGTPFHIPSSPHPWPRGETPRQAGITAFGFGGAVAHVILEEPPQAPSLTEGRAAALEGNALSGLLCFSARSEKALKQLAEAYATFLHDALALRDFCACASAGRADFTHRAAVWAHDSESMRQALKAVARGNPGAMSWTGNGQASSSNARVDSNQPEYVALASQETDGRQDGIGGIPPSVAWLAQHYVGGAQIDWESFYPSPTWQRISLPGHPFERIRCWIEGGAEDLVGARPRGTAQFTAASLGTLASSNKKPVRPSFSVELLGTTQDERHQVLRSYLEEKIAHALGVGREELNPDQSLLEMGLDSLMMMEIMGALSQDLCVVVYPREVFERPTLGALTEFVARELDALAQDHGNGNGNGKHASPRNPLQANDDPAMSAPAPAKGIDFFKLRLRRGQSNGNGVSGQNAPAIFLLSTPRSGSTLLRVMLAGHPALFCPPELHLLPFKSMQERQHELEGTGLERGLARALKEAQNLSASEAERTVSLMEAADVPVQNVYRLLQHAPEKTLLDKSPTYSGAVEIMQRAEQLFQRPLYVYLQRHPMAVIDSLVNNRLDQMVANRAASPHQTAEAIWTLGNYNIHTFLRGIEASRWHTLSYEDLVRDPEVTLRALTAFLGIDFDTALLHPYEGSRMTDGLHVGEHSVGDPGFLNHHEIEAALGEKWRELRLPDPLKPATARLALDMGYEMPHGIAGRLPMQGVLGAAVEGTL